MSKAAQELGVDPAELRRKNFIQPSQFPYQTPVAVVYDTGDYEATLDKALELADYAGFPQRRAEAKASGKLRGIGMCELYRGLRHRAIEPRRSARRPRGTL